jgi:hypothetical protein
MPITWRHARIATTVGVVVVLGPTVAVVGARAFGWALLDTESGEVSGSANLATRTNTVESMIKPWIASDYLRRLADAARSPRPRY